MFAYEYPVHTRITHLIYTYTENTLLIRFTRVHNVICLTMRITFILNFALEEVNTP